MGKLCYPKTKNITYNVRLLRSPFAHKNSQYQIINEIETSDPESAPNSINDRPEVRRKWIKGLRLCVLGVVLAFIAHLALLLKLAADSAANGYGWSSLTSAVYKGDCDSAHQMATGLHVLVNVIVLALTGASSYCCQILSAPSRARIDYAHSKRVWVSIGASSFSNIWYAPLWRKVLWFLVWGTSIPVQLLYNSFVYVSIGATDYGIMAAPSNFINTTDFSDWSVPGDLELDKVLGMNLESIQEEIKNGSFEKMPYVTCTEFFSQGYQTDYGTLVATLNTSKKIFAWPCQLGASDGDLTMHPGSDYSNGYSCALSTTFNSDGYYSYSNMLVAGSDENELGSCYAQKVSPACQLGCSLPIGLVVLACICLKLLCVVITAMEQRKEIILTIGDAIASFLRRTDPYTVNNCLMARSNKGQPKTVLHFKNDYPWVSVFSKAVPFRAGQTPPPQPKRISNTNTKWLYAVPRRLFGFLLILKAVIIIAAIVIFAASGSISGMGEISAERVGALHESRMSFPDWGFFPTILAVNLPQAAITVIYAIYNNVLTRTLLCAEYNSYAVKRKPLRVSFPTGEQRGTYRLSIPYRYSIPFLATFTTAHWLCSQAIYLIQFVPRDSSGDFIFDRQLNGLAVSPFGLKMMMIPMLLAVGGIILLVQRRFKSTAMPLAMNCSAAIAAACHPPPGDELAAEKPVMWGEVNIEVANLHTHMGEGLPDLKTECRHCSFTSHDTRKPDPEVVYY
ncbi:hypothetical protein N7456_010270 [Penicillium angulare]|uniref:DUF6536 domain-containing protein n=1 Tax=Penicillium angulare TaxID=116970 RepID=A0A9W9K615_9EURO|nr:hypothetical protein N7456_010270 [Penicillium angulare]